MTPLRLLHIEDDLNDAELILRQLRHDGLDVEVVQVATADDLRAQMARGPWDLVLSDHVMPGLSSIAALDIVKAEDPDLPLLIVSGRIGEEAAVDAIRCGAVDYVSKERLALLAPAVRRAIDEARERRLRRESEQRLRLAIENQFDSFAIHSAVRDDDGKIVDLRWEFVNAAACEYTRLTAEQLVGHRLLEYFPEVEEHGWLELFANVIETGEPVVADDVEFEGTFGGERRRVFSDIRVVKHGDGCVVSRREATERHMAHERARLVTGLYATLSRVNEAIGAASDRTSLYRTVCEAVVEHAGIAMAWVGEPDESTGWVRVVAGAGEHTDYLEGIRISARDDPEGRGPTGTAIREGRHVLAPDFTTDAVMAPWRKRALATGFRSSAAFPLRCGGRVVGAIMLYAEEPRFFEEEEIKLLDRLAGDVSYALDALDSEARRGAAAAALQRTATLLAEGEEVAGFGSWEWDAQTGETTWSPGLGRILGIPPDQPKGWESLRAAVGGEIVEYWRENIAGDIGETGAALRASQMVTRETTIHAADGTERVLTTVIKPVLDERGDLCRVVGTTQEITERKRAEETLWLQARLLDEVGAGVIVTDLEGTVTSWNRGAQELHGWTPEEALGRPIAELIVPADARQIMKQVAAALAQTGQWEGTAEVLRKDGSLFPALIHDTLLAGKDGRPLGVVGISIDISDRLAAEEHLRETRDFLQSVTESMGEGLITTGADGHVVYANVAALEVLGWERDGLLGQSLEEVVLGCSGPPDGCVLCRLEPGDGSQRLEKEIFVRRDGRPLPVALTVSPMAREGRDGWVFVFSDDTERRAEQERLERELEALGWMGRIREALRDEALVLFAQPIIDIRTQKVCQHELLVRMRAADGSIIPPGEFLPVAERYGLIKGIDRWVIKQGIALARKGHAVQINISAPSLGDREVADWLHERILHYGVDPAKLTFEVTETALLADEAAGASFASRLAELGCPLALDDFGTGYGGLTYLKRLHVDMLKIDIEFVRDLLKDPASRHVVSAVVALAKGFGLRTVGEGVEDQQTLEALAELGVDMAQGFHTGRPAPVEQVFGAAVATTG